MVMGSGVPVIFPSLGSMLWHSLPSTGSPRVGSPASAVPRSAPPPCRPSRRASLPSLGGTAPVLVFRSRGPRAPHPRAWASLPGCPSRTFGTETTRVPRFLGKSRCAHAPLFDPGELFTPGRSRRVDAAFRGPNDVGTRGYFLSGLNHAAYTLPVYASQGGSLRHHATLGSGWWPASAGRGWLPAGLPSKGFRDRLHLFPLSQA